MNTHGISLLHRWSSDPDPAAAAPSGGTAAAHRPRHLRRLAVALSVAGVLAVPALSPAHIVRNLAAHGPLAKHRFPAPASAARPAYAAIAAPGVHRRVSEPIARAPASARPALWHGNAVNAIGTAADLRASWQGGFAPRVHVGWYGGRGHWDHGWRDGRYGYWFFAAGAWTYYPTPPWWFYDPYYYDYPPFYADGYVAPGAALIYNNLPSQPQTWYYCDAAKGYFPTVQSCPGGWRPVQATRPGAAAASPVQPAPAPATTAEPH